MVKTAVKNDQFTRNIHYEWLKEQIDSAEVNEHTAECLNRAALKLISVFDANKDYKALELAQYQFEKIRELEKDKSYFMINILQLKKRKEDLTEQDIYELKSIVSSDLQISFGVKVLLEDKEGAKLIFEEMDEETQEFIKAFPIYHLYES